MFRFTIRELILVTVVVAMGLAWRVDHEQLQKQLTTQTERTWRWWTVAGSLESMLDFMDHKVTWNLPNGSFNCRSGVNSAFGGFDGHVPTIGEIDALDSCYAFPMLDARRKRMQFDAKLKASAPGQ